MRPRSDVRRPGVLRGWHLIVLAWLAVCWARPLSMGFYDDDWLVVLLPAQWTAAWSWARLTYYLELYANRPTTGLLSYFLSSLCGESAVAWHAAISGLVLAAALAVRAFLRSLLRLCRREPGWAPDLAAALWVVFPFTLGLVGRPTQGPCIACVVLFALSGAVLFDRWRRGRAAGFAPALLYLAGILAYESLYGAFLVLLLIAWVAGVPRRVSWRSFGVTAGTFAVVQVAAVVWNRSVVSFDPTAPSKALCPVWAAKLADNVLRLRYFIGHSASELSPAVELFLFALLAGAAWLVLLQLRRPGASHSAARSLGVWFACGVGVVLGLGVLSVAGYSLMGVGLSSRTATAPALWLAVAVAVALASVPPRPVLLRPAAVGVSLVLMVMFAYATNQRIRDWAGAWRVEQQVLADAPLDDLKHAQPGAVVLYFGPEMYNNVRTFGYMGNIDLAMEYVYPQYKSLNFCCAARDNWIAKWDGRNFEQRLANAAPWERWPVWNQVETPEVWVWVRGTGHARRIATPFEYHGVTNNTAAGDPVFKVELPFVFCDDVRNDPAELANR